MFIMARMRATNYASVDVGHQTDLTPTTLAPGQRYYFAVTACDQTRINESGFSTELRATALAGDDLSVDFGAAGLWKRADGTWAKLTSWNPEHLASWANKVAVSFDSGKGLHT